MSVLSTAIRDSVFKARVEMTEAIDQFHQQGVLLMKLNQLATVVNNKMDSNDGLEFVESDIVYMESISTSVIAFHGQRKYIMDKIEAAERLCDEATGSGFSLAEELGDLVDAIGETKMRFDEYAYLYEDTIAFYNVVSTRVTLYKPTRIIVSKERRLYREKYNRAWLLLILIVIYSTMIYFVLSHSGA